MEEKTGKSIKQLEEEISRKKIINKFQIRNCEEEETGTLRES